MQTHLNTHIMQLENILKNFSQKTPEGYPYWVSEFHTEHWIPADITSLKTQVFQVHPLILNETEDRTFDQLTQEAFSISGKIKQEIIDNYKNISIQTITQNNLTIIILPGEHITIHETDYTFIINHVIMDV